MTTSVSQVRSTAELIACLGQGHKPRYLFFWGHQPQKDGSISKSCFSQWFEAAFTVDGTTYATAEHFMMAEKARLFADEEARARILSAGTPAQAKKLGRGVKGFDEQAWDDARFGIVVKGNLAKFSQNPPLAEFLSQTGDRVLVEASPVDRIWGIGLAATDAEALTPHRWHRLNLLGFALMEVRAALAMPQAQSPVNPRK